MPPFMVAAVNVTEFPWQNGFSDAFIETLTGRIGFTTMVIVLDVSGLFKMHPVMDEVKMQDTRSPDAGLYEYVVELVPTLIPLTFH